jgi:TPR repeat protein
MAESHDLETLSLDHLRSLAAGGDAAGEHELGRRFLEGIGVAADLPAALGLFRSSADKGYAPAEYELGRAYDPIGMARLYGIDGNSALSLQWHLKAATQGDRRSIVMVATVYRYGMGGLPADSGKAAEWYRRLAESGDALAMLNLGLIAVEGARDDEASAWLRRAARLGAPTAIAVLRGYIEQGVLPPIGPEEELELLDAGIRAGDESAFLILGLKYEQGQDVPRDVVKAFVYLTLVSYSEEAKGGPGPASDAVARLRNELTPAEHAAATERLEQTMEDLNRICD